MRARLLILIAAVLAIDLAHALAADALDFATYRTQVEALFLQKRAGHTRCYVCHVEANNNFRLQKLAPGRTGFTEEQSRQNFEMVSKLVNPGDAATSRLLLHPLAPEGGGDAFHSGGRQFADQNDPDWKMLAAWVNGGKK